MPYRASTALEAANLALGELGEPPIGSFQDNSARARAVGRWYGIVRDACQRDHDYGFCAAHVVPARHPLPALGRLRNRFPLPDDCLKVREAVPFRPELGRTHPGIVITDPTVIAALERGAAAPIGEPEWEIEAASVGPSDAPPAAMVLVTNMHQPLVTISRRIDIVRLWDPLFVEVFAKELAAKMAAAIAKDISAGQEKHAEAQDAADDAARTDSREQSPRQISRETSWARSRYLGSGYRGGRY